MEKHKFNIFPAANEDDFARLVSDIVTNGYDSSMPITVFQGGILDGWNRWNACLETDETPTRVEFVGSDLDAINFAMRTNKRRNLTSSQWAAVAVEAEDFIADIAATVEEERRKKQADTLTKTHAGVSDNKLSETKNEHENKVATKTAEAFNTNRTYVNEAKRLKEDNPEEFERVKSGEATITQIKNERKVADRKKEIDSQRESIKNNTFSCPEGLYQVVSMDPPWSYGRAYDPETSRVANPYPEMKQQELLELSPPFDKDCVLFLWTTHQFIFDAKELLDRWGFTYKANIVWDKESLGMGYWFRMQCEFCLVGIKGKPLWDNTRWRDIIKEKRREHSRKPDSFFRMVEDITTGKRLEYFSREKREGWEVFGNDTEKF